MAKVITSLEYDYRVHSIPESNSEDLITEQGIDNSMSLVVDELIRNGTVQLPSNPNFVFDEDDDLDSDIPDIYPDLLDSFVTSSESSSEKDMQESDVSSASNGEPESNEMDVTNVEEGSSDERSEELRTESK